MSIQREVTNFEVLHVEARHYPFTFGVGADWQPTAEFAANNGIKRGQTLMLEKRTKTQEQHITPMMDIGWRTIAETRELTGAAWKWTGAKWTQK